MTASEAVFDRIQELSPQNDTQRSLHARALNLAMEIGETRWLMFEQASTSISTPMLLVVIFALTITFTSFSLHAAPNPTVIVTLLLCALAVASTLFLILEMYRPFQGMIQISTDPLRNALAQLGQQFLQPPSCLQLLRNRSSGALGFAGRCEITGSTDSCPVPRWGSLRTIRERCTLES